MIDIRSEQRLISIQPVKIRDIAKKVLNHFRLGKEVQLNILFLNDEKMSKLHRHFLGKEKATDVLAFGMQEGRPLKGNPYLLGDIAISTETALRHARRFHSSVDRELTLYVIHGILHLLGYKDQHRQARLKMRHKEKELLKVCQSGALRRASITPSKA